ncbi:unnamed protein product [Allacma fusca]|uniref:Uncharacterized protein n=1 Tax=Allacma fusca TaxID=39272 RepID=A0A8J2LB84_9HEXA|nr:unnamed protein product [Allacma fusca]
MPHGVSEFRSTVGVTGICCGSGGIVPPAAIEMKVLRSNRPADMGSVDSSDTYASCQTHPFMSQEELESNVYVNPMDGGENDRPTTSTSFGHGGTQGQPSSPWGSPRRKPALRTAVRSSSGEGESIRGSQDNSSPARTRRARFQQVPTSDFPSSSKTRSKTEDCPKRTGGSHDSLTKISSAHDEKKSRRPSFLPTKGIASATKLINQHLFGAGTGLTGSKSSLEQRALSPSDRRNKPILKKGDLRFDPETERLIDDGGSLGDGSSSRSGSVSSTAPAVKSTTGKGKTSSSSSSASTASCLKAPIKFMGVDEDADTKSHSRLPKSPMPRDVIGDLLQLDQTNGLSQSSNQLESSDSSTISPGGGSASTIVSRPRLPPPLTPTPSSTTSSKQPTFDDLLYADCSPNEDNRHFSRNNSNDSNSSSNKVAAS